MLLDIPFQEQHIKLDPKHYTWVVTDTYIEATMSKKFTRRIVEKHSPGIFWACDLYHTLPTITNFKVVAGVEHHPWGLFASLHNAEGPPSFGSADTLEQIKHTCRQYWDSDRTFILALLTVTKKDSPGWRFHKNGPYLGDKRESDYECLGDEPNMKEVLTFEFIEVEQLVGNEVGIPSAV